MFLHMRRDCRGNIVLLPQTKSVTKLMSEIENGRGQSFARRAGLRVARWITDAGVEFSVFMYPDEVSPDNHDCSYQNVVSILVIMARNHFVLHFPVEQLQSLPPTFFGNTGRNSLIWKSLVSSLHPKLRYSAGVFHALWLCNGYRVLRNWYSQLP